ncbi:MAG: response regulator [Leptolyngbya sp. PLA3]|nr:MAG: response regulator [Cyanobacteria bacterium CYA]MCE7968634.1 response regulator [Leptolyngbya sp. PL-A3]
MPKGRVWVTTRGMSPEELAQLQSALPEGTELVAEQAVEAAALAVNALIEGVILSDGNGKVLWANDCFGSMDDVTRSRIRSVCAEAAAWFAQRTQSGTATLRDLVCKFDVSSGDETKMFEVFVTPAVRRKSEDEVCRADDAARVVAVMHDVTRQRRRQQKMEAIDRAGYELVRLDAEAIAKMNSMDRLRVLEEKIVRYMRDVLHYDHFAIFLIDERTRRLQLVMSKGLPQEIQDLELYPEADGSGISGYVAATGQSFICSDAQSNELFLPGLAGAQSSLTVPLLLHHQVIGIIDIESQKVRAFDEEDRYFMEMFARSIALALHMLDLLVLERCTTNRSVSGRFEGELNEPLEDILNEVDWLIDPTHVTAPEAAGHIARIRADVEAIRSRVKDVASGPQTLLGVERAFAEKTQDPLIAGRRILVADDHPKIRKIIGELLRSKGATVEIAGSGDEAIAHVEEAVRQNAPRFDLVISDIQMHDRNGYEVFSAARKASVNTRVILMTGFGYDPHHSIVRASQEGLQAVIFKPFEIEVLLEQVRKALAQADGTAHDGKSQPPT